MAKCSTAKWIAILLGLSTLGFAQAKPSADLIVMNAKIWTGDANPSSDSVAVLGDRIVAVGAVKDVELWRGPATKVVDAGGHLLVPGFNDAHVHFTPGHFDVSWAEQDANTLFPLDRLHELLAAGEIGKVAEYHVSMGLTTELRKLKEQVSWHIVAAIQSTRPDIVVLTGG